MRATSRRIATQVALLVACHVCGEADALGLGQRHRAREPVPARAAAEKTFPVDVTWVLRTVDGKPLPIDDPPSFSIDQTLRGRGFAGCNTFSMAFYPVKSQSLASGAIALTRRTCPPPAMTLERSVLAVLHSLPKWDLRSDGDLTITAGHLVLLFRRGI